MECDRFNRRSAMAMLLISLGFLGSWLHADEFPSVPKRVTMIVDYGDGVQKHFTALAWRDEMTVMDVLRLAQKHPRGVKFVHRGKGATAFLSKIDDLENEGNGRNWIYHVNDKMADRSFAVFPVKPGDTILWKFGQYR